MRFILKGSSYTDIPHNIGYYPDLVIVQLKLPNGYISEAQGKVKLLLSSTFSSSFFFDNLAERIDLSKIQVQCLRKNRRTHTTRFVVL